VVRWSEEIESESEVKEERVWEMWWGRRWWSSLLFCTLRRRDLAWRWCGRRRLLLKNIEKGEIETGKRVRERERRRK
jgi:hypothetical protein